MDTPVSTDRRSSPTFIEEYAIDGYASLAYCPMVFKETSIFTRQVLRLLDQESYQLFQLRLLAEPDAGVLIRGAGGIRKLRWPARGRGTSGGVRVIYYWATDRDEILLLLIYPKSEQDDLTPRQRRVLAALVKEEFG